MSVCGEGGWRSGDPHFSGLFPCLTGDIPPITADVRVYVLERLLRFGRVFFYFSSSWLINGV